MAGWQDLVVPQGTAQLPAQQLPAAGDNAWQSLGAPIPAAAAQEQVQPAGLQEYIEGAVPGARQMSGAAAVANHETKRAANAITTALGGAAPYPGEEQKNAGDVYRDALTQNDQRREAFVEQELPKNPILRIPLEGMLNLPGLAGSVGAAPAAAIGPAAAVLGGATGPATVGQAIKTGAILGGISGANASDLTNPTVAAAKTGIGAATGGAIGLGASAVAAPAANTLTDWFARKFGGQNAVENQAARMVMGRIQQDAAAGGPKAQDMIDLLNAGSNTPQAVVDVAGENTKALAGQLARRPGEARQYVIGTLNARDQGAQQRMVSGIDQNISPAGRTSAYSTEQALIQARQAASRPAYQAAGIPSDPAQYASAPTVSNPEITRLFDKSADVRSAIAQAKKLPDYADLPDNSMVLLDKAYKSIGGDASEATRAGNGERARDLNSLRVQLKDAITGGDPNHPYQLALDAYSGPSQSLDAVRLGQEFLSKSPEQVTGEIGQLSPNDAEFYRLGAADTLRRNVMKTGAAGNEANALAKNPYVEQQTRSLFANPQDGDNFFSSVVQPEQRMFQTRTGTIGNSATAARVAEDANKPSLFQGIYQIGHGVGTGNIGAGLEGLGNVGAALGITSRNPQVDLAAAKMLLNPDVIANRALILRAANQRPAISRIPLASLPAASIAGRAYPALTSALSGQQTP